MASRSLLIILAATAALLLGACFNPDLTGPGAGFHCPCDAGWYCQKNDGAGRCIEGSNPGDQAAPKKDKGTPKKDQNTTKKDQNTTKNDTNATKPDVTPGTKTCHITAPEQVINLAYKDVLEDFDIARHEKYNLSYVSWGTKSGSSVKAHWVQLKNTAWQGSAVVASDGGDETALGLYTLNAKEMAVVFYYSAASKMLKMYHPYGTTKWLVVDPKAEKGKYLSVIPAKTNGQFYISYQEGLSNIRVIHYEALPKSGKVLKTWNTAGPSLVSSVGYGLDSRLDSKGKLQVAYHSYTPNYLYFSTLDQTTGGWVHAKVDTLPTKFAVGTYAETGFSASALVYGNYSGSKYTISHKDGLNSGINRGPGILPSLDGDSVHEAIAHNGNSKITIRTRKQGGAWFNYSPAKLLAAPKRVKIRRSFVKTSAIGSRIWEVVYRGYDGAAGTHKLYHFTLTCKY